MKIGIVGCGFIGTELAKIIDKSDSVLVGINDISQENINNLTSQLNNKTESMDIDKLITSSDLIIEAAHPNIVPVLLEKCVENKKDIIMMSIGGLINHINLLEKAEKTIKVYLPSGAIAGLDAINAAAQADINNIELITTKSPTSLGLNINEKQVIFEGSVEEAVKKYPKNINVSAAIAIASKKPVKVKIMCDPETTTNTHEIILSGNFGKITTKCENIPSPQNPKTSYLALLSAIALIKEIVK